MFEWPRKSVLLVPVASLTTLCHDNFCYCLIDFMLVTKLINFRYRRYSKVLMIVSYRFLKFLHHWICDQGIHWRHSNWATLFGWPRKSTSTSGTWGTQRYWWLCLIDFWNFFTIYFFEVRESIADILSELLRSGDHENLGLLPVQDYPEVLMIVSYGFSQYLQNVSNKNKRTECESSQIGSSREHIFLLTSWSRFHEISNKQNIWSKFYKFFFI